MASLLHLARLDAVTHELRMSGASHVVDLGCGRGELLLRLREFDQFLRLIGIDVDTRSLSRARSVLNIDLLRPDNRLHVCFGSFEETDWVTPAFVGKLDAAVLLETIEHIDPGRLPRVEHSVFGCLRPNQVLVTTPNKEYNPMHGLSKGQKRHPGHRFEWTRAQFKSWCTGIAERNDYLVRFKNIGPLDPVYGSTTQMACFDMAT